MSEAAIPLGLRIVRFAKQKKTQRVVVLLILVVVVPRVMIFYVVCGLVDLMRNTRKSSEMFRKYFIGSGSLTWFLSPLNILLDVIALPYWNKGVYRLEDLPLGHREELERLFELLEREKVVERIEERLEGTGREMIFFKWYGHNRETPLDIPAFHENYKYIMTIGVSVFNEKASTSKHFGPFRPTLRVLYNLNPVESDRAYIDVGTTRNYWNQNRLFIFDDTLFHQSINETEEKRYCAFIDIVRPSPWPRFQRAIVMAFGSLLVRFNGIFYNAWSFLK